MIRFFETYCRADIASVVDIVSSGCVWVRSSKFHFQNLDQTSAKVWTPNLLAAQQIQRQILKYQLSINLKLLNSCGATSFIVVFLTFKMFLQHGFYQHKIYDRDMRCPAHRKACIIFQCLVTYCITNCWKGGKTAAGTLFRQRWLLVMRDVTICLMGPEIRLHILERKGVRKGGLGLKKNPWVWYFTKNVLPSQGD